MESFADCPAEAFTCEVHDRLAVLNLATDLFAIVTDLDLKERLFRVLDRLDKSPDIDAVLVVNAPGGLDEVRYEEFLRLLFAADQPAGHPASRTDLEREKLLSREEYGVSQLILKIHRFSRPTIAGLQGTVAPPSLGAALACDFRLAAADATFVLSCSRLGLPPGGALGFFLPRFIGQGRAVEAVLTGAELSAPEALSLGLLNDLVEAEDFAAACVERSRRLVNVPPAVASCAKALLSPYADDELARYLERECEIMRAAWRRHAVQLQEA